MKALRQYKPREIGKRFEMDIGREALAVDRRIRKKQVKIIKLKKINA